MRIADYPGKFWTGPEVMYGVIIAMTFTGMFGGVPFILRGFLTKIVLAALFCCITRGMADRLLSLWERNYIIRQENLTIERSKMGDEKDPALTLFGE